MKYPEKKLNFYSTTISLVKKFILDPSLHNKYFKNYRLEHSRNHNTPIKLLIQGVGNNTSYITEKDLIRLQLNLMKEENIEVKNFSILTQAVINYLLDIEEENNLTPIYDKTQDTEHEVLVELIYKQLFKNGYVLVKQVLLDFGLTFSQFKKYDKKLATIFAEEGFIKSRKTINKIKHTIYTKDQDLDTVTQNLDTDLDTVS